MNGFIKKNVLQKKTSVILIVLVVFWYGMTVWANLLHYNYIMNSDLAFEAILGRLIFEKKEWIPTTWYASTELRLICTPQLAALMNVITDNMNLSMGLACSLISLLLLGSIFLFCKKAEMKINHACMMVFFCMAIPGTLEILELLYLFAGYYAEHVIIFFLSMAVYVTMLKGKVNTNCYILMGLCQILALVLGIQGTRGILITYGPMFGIEVIRLIYLKYCKTLFRGRDGLTFGFVTLQLLLSYAGTMFPISVGQDISTNLRKGLYKLWIEVLPDTLQAIGFTESHVIRHCCLVLLVLSVVVQVIEILIRMIRKEKIEPLAWCFLVTAASPFVSALLVAFTTVESSERYYFMWNFSMAFSLILLWKRLIGKPKKMIVIAIAAILTFFNIKDIYFKMAGASEPPSTDAYEVVTYLEKNHLPVAYSTFENANKMTVLSNGRIHVYAVNSLEDMKECKWLSSTDWYPPEMPYGQRTAYIVPNTLAEEFQRFMDFGRGIDCRLETEIGTYSIWVSECNYTTK